MALYEIGLKEFVRALKQGFLNIERHEREINEINYFPIPDKDTGTNVLRTFKRAIKELNKDSKSIHEALDSLILKSLEDAQGNIGLILTQFFAGFASGLDAEEKLSPLDFGKALDRAVKEAYFAVAQPKEGTILTVMRKFKECFKKESGGKDPDFIEILKKCLQQAKRALEETKNILEPLKEKGVVDAGALVFYLFLEGFLEGLLKKEFFEVQVILKDSARRTEIFERLKNRGESLVVTKYRDSIKVHIHTYEPQKVMDELKKLGKIVKKEVNLLDESGF